MNLPVFFTTQTKASQLSKDLGVFLIENIYLILGLLVGVVVAIVMRKTFKMKP